MIGQRRHHLQRHVVRLLARLPLAVLVQRLLVRALQQLQENVLAAVARVRSVLGERLVPVHLLNDLAEFPAIFVLAGRVRLVRGALQGRCVEPSRVCWPTRLRREANRIEWLLRPGHLLLPLSENATQLLVLVRNDI